MGYIVCHFMTHGWYNIIKAKVHSTTLLSNSRTSVIWKHTIWKKLFEMNGPQQESYSIRKNLGDLSLQILINCILIKTYCVKIPNTCSDIVLER